MASMGITFTCCCAWYSRHLSHAYACMNTNRMWLVSSAKDCNVNSTGSVWAQCRLWLLSKFHQKHYTLGIFRTSLPSCAQGRLATKQQKAHYLLMPWSSWHKQLANSGRHSDNVRRLWAQPMRQWTRLHTRDTDKDKKRSRKANKNWHQTWSTCCKKHPLHDALAENLVDLKLSGLFDDCQNTLFNAEGQCQVWSQHFAALLQPSLHEEKSINDT